MSSPRRHRVAFAAIVLALPPRAARADTPVAVPAPFVLPDLSHAGIDARIDQLAGRLAPIDAGRPAATALMLVPSFETSPFASHALYLGMAYAIGSALPPDGGLVLGEAARASGTRTFLGNVEAHLRAVFPLPRSMPAAAALRNPQRTALEIGFLLSVVAPTATFDRTSRPDRSAAEAVASLAPTSYAHFLPHRVVLQPAGDLRIVRGRLVFHGRHGIDGIVDIDGVNPMQLAGRLVGHIGFLARQDLELSLEAQQVYFFAGSESRAAVATTPDVAFDERYRLSDARRSAWTLAAGVRFASPSVDVGVSLFTNAGDVLSPAADSLIGLRVSMIAHARP